MKLLKTTKEGLSKPHDHIAFVSQNGGITSLDVGHTHNIRYIPAVPEQRDEQGNIVQEAQPERYEIDPAEDGHTHSGLIEIEPSFKRKKEKDDEIVADVKELYKTAREIEGESLEKGKESEDFYMGKQWDDETKSNLEALNRAAITINLVEKDVDQLSGYQREQKADIHMVAVEGGDQRAADILNPVIKSITERCYFHREESKVFEDAVITGRGNFNIYVSHEKNIRGDIIIEKFPFGDVVYGPHEKEDLSDCEYLIKHKMFSKEKIKQLWPDKANKIEKDYEAYQMMEESTTDGEIKKHTQYPINQYALSDNWMPVTIGGDQMVDLGKKEFRVIELWRVVYIPSYIIFNPDMDFYFKAVGWKTSDIKRVKTIPGFYAIPRSEKKMRITRVSGNVVLSDENPADLPVDDFFVIPLYAKKRGNKFKGKVESAKDPQREINKRRSQAIDIGNKMAAYGWFYDSMTFPENEKERFKRMSTSPGFTIELTDVNRPPRQVEGTKFPGEIVQLMQMSEQTLSQLMNISIESGGANESAAHLLHRQKMKMAGNEYLFDNLEVAKRKIGRILLYLIKQYYQPDRILSIIGENVATEDEIQQILDNIDESKYDFVITESSAAPTTRIATYMLLSDLAQQGTPVPPEVLIEVADLPEDKKQQIIQSIQAQNQAQGEAQKAAADAEIDKTLIARGVVPPSVSMRLQQEAMQMQQQQQQMQQNGQNFIGSDQGNPLAQ